MRLTLQMILKPKAGVKFLYKICPNILQGVKIFKSKL